MSHPQKGAAVLNALLSFALIFTAGYGVYEIVPIHSTPQQASAVLALGETDVSAGSESAKPDLETAPGSARCDSSKSRRNATNNAAGGTEEESLNNVCVPGCTYDVYQESASTEFATKVLATDTCPQINGQATLSCAASARCIVRYCIGGKPCEEAGSKSLPGGSAEQFLKQKLGMSSAAAPVDIKESPDLQKVLDLAKTNPAAAQEMLSGMSQPLQAAYKELQTEAVQQNKAEIQNNIEAIKELGASNPAAQQEYQNKITALQEENQKLAQVNPGLVTSHGTLAASESYPELGPISNAGNRDSMPEFARGQDTFADPEVREGLGAIPQVAEQGASPAEYDYVQKLKGGWAFDTLAAGATEPEYDYEASLPEQIERLSDGSCIQEDELGHSAAVTCPPPALTTYGALWRPLGDDPYINEGRGGGVGSTAPELDGAFTPLSKQETIRYAELAHETWQEGYDFQGPGQVELERLKGRYLTYGVEGASAGPLSQEQAARLEELENKGHDDMTVAERVEWVELNARSRADAIVRETLNNTLPIPEDFPLTDIDRAAIEAQDKGLGYIPPSAAEGASPAESLYVKRLNGGWAFDDGDLTDPFPGASSPQYPKLDDIERTVAQCQLSMNCYVTGGKRCSIDPDNGGTTSCEDIPTTVRSTDASSPPLPVWRPSPTDSATPSEFKPLSPAEHEKYKDFMMNDRPISSDEIKQMAELQDRANKYGGSCRYGFSPEGTCLTGSIDADTARQLYAEGWKCYPLTVTPTGTFGNCYEAAPAGTTPATPTSPPVAEPDTKAPVSNPKKDKDYGPGTETLPSKKDKDYGPGTETTPAPAPRADGKPPADIAEQDGICFAVASNSSERLYLANRGYQCDATGVGSYSCTKTKGSTGCSPAFNPTPVQTAPQPTKSGTSAPSPTTQNQQRPGTTQQGTNTAQPQQAGTQQGGGASQTQNQTTPTPVTAQQPAPKLGEVLTGEYYCVTSMVPLLVTKFSAGDTVPVTCYNAEYQTAQAAQTAPKSPLTQKPLWDTQTGLPCTDPFANKIVCGTVQSVPLPWQKPAAAPSVSAQNLQNYPGWQPGSVASISQTGGMCYASIYNQDQFTYAIARGYTCQYGMYPTVCSKPDLGAPSSCTSP